MTYASPALRLQNDRHQAYVSVILTELTSQISHHCFFKQTSIISFSWLHSVSVSRREKDSSLNTVTKYVAFAYRTTAIRPQTFVKHDFHLLGSPKLHDRSTLFLALSKRYIALSVQATQETWST